MDGGGPGSRRGRPRQTGGNNRPWRRPPDGGRGASAGSQRGQGRPYQRGRSGPERGEGAREFVNFQYSPHVLEEIGANYQHNDQPTNQQHKNHNERRNRPQNKQQNPRRERTLGFRELEDISQCEGVDIIERINRNKTLFRHLLETPVEKKKQDVFALMMTLVTNVWKTSFEESKKLLLLDFCNSKFVDHLQLYLMQLPYASHQDKYFNKYYWTKEIEFWRNFMTFCACIINVSPSTAVHKCGSLIEAVTKSCLDGLKAKHGFELPEEYAVRMTKIRDSLKTCDEEQKTKVQRRVETNPGEPPENFRELSVLPTPEELVNSQPFLRANVVDGSYRDKEHYLDVQFRLLREDCFGPLRDGIHQFIVQPKKKKYDNIRVYNNVKFLEPFVSKQKIGSTVLFDESTTKRFSKMKLAQSKRLLFGSLVLFTKDHCRSFLIGTVLERDEKYLSKGQLPVKIVNIDASMEANLYNDNLYTMMECEVYFEPYYHVLKALQDPNFPEHLAMSNYIIDVQKVPEIPAYLTADASYTVKTKDETDVTFTVLQDKTWPSETTLGLNSSQYDAYKLALTHEFAVIQGPPGTGKTFIGVKIAQSLLENVPFLPGKCHLLVICYTNHALDQFLAALLPVTRSMARIGGRSRNQVLEPFNINNLRRKDDSKYFHERRINLKLEIGAIEHAHTQINALQTGVLTYFSVAVFVEDSKILKKFYKDVPDPLKHWLFETANYVDCNELLEEQVENQEEEGSNEDIDEDEFERCGVLYDDLDSDDIPGEIRGFDFIRTSFSLTDAVDEYTGLLKRISKSETKALPLKDQHKLQDRLSYLHSHIKTFKEMQPYRSRTPRINLKEVQDMSAVPDIERWTLYFKWAEVAMQFVRKEIKALESKLKSTAEAYEEARMMVDLAVLKRTQVVGMTTSGASRLRKLLVEISPRIVVVEEAAEVLEAHIVTSLTKSCQHLILIGDHQQLRPAAASVRLARRYGLEVSLFERMVRNAVHGRRLRVQHRMRPALAALLCPHIYPDLQNHRSVEDFPPVRGVQQDLFFFTHQHREQSEDDSSSRTNTFEADMTLRLANYLMQQGYNSEEVTILAAYSGQMFYLRKQRPRYAHLANVKITVLDSYQGEESKIILLSLVRNNSNDSIGFLGTDNRVCVALSRAREGFYIFGNIDMLKRKSPLWSNIAKTLADGGSLGNSLKLKCVNHKDQITMIEEVKDFLKVPEGGCRLDCKYRLPCGHACPRVCHAYDLQHAAIACTQDCDRKICLVEDHSCPLPCARKCEPCGRLVEKSLPCGHNQVVPCHKEPGDPSIYCKFVVSVTLPDCGHVGEKACSMKVSEVRCAERCPAARLACGHACRRACHAADDPHHERYTCLKPCPKPNKGCTANLEGDLKEHQCRRSCFEECLPCNVQVNKKRAACRHSKMVACHESADAAPCRQNCARLLPCNHFCKKLCSEKCGDCKVKVKKVVAECGHEVAVECGAEATRALCRRRCERALPCGHACAARCDEPCARRPCARTMDRLFDAPCGHKVKLPCNVYSSMMNGGIDPKTLLAHCEAPCGEVLRCGHSCGGSCSACHQGRLHAACSAACHQLNICGHRCEEPCNQVCPPCARRCEVRCEHSPCGRVCGAPCTPCAEPCKRACEHSACTRRCGARCDRAPCAERCGRRQACGHPCRGLCGEPCPRACRQCAPASFPGDLLGDPYDDKDKLVQLQDCPHIMDVDTLDNLMSSQSETVQIKTCPFCRQPIINTHRYKDHVNRMLKNEINPIKEKVYGTDSQRQKKKTDMLLKVDGIIKAFAETAATEHIEWLNACIKIHKVLKSSVKDKKVSLLQLEMNDIYLNILRHVGDYCVEYKQANITKLGDEFQNQVNLICKVLAANVHKISQQQQVDIANELRRTNSMIQHGKILSHVSYLSNKTNPNVALAAEAAREAVLSWRVFDEDAAVAALSRLQAAVQLSGVARKEERAAVVRAVGLKAGHWFKCPNGHFYCIGECGGAMQLARCPDCGAAIGGRNHALTAGNSHAGEMDDSQHAAWSQEMNLMANFRRNDI